MSIVRIFRVQVHPGMETEFEQKFSSVSVAVASEAEGFEEVSIFKPTKWAPNEYAMISQWANEAALKALAGENWNTPLIPAQMAKYIAECWVHHFVSWDDA